MPNRPKPNIAVTSDQVAAARKITFNRGMLIRSVILTKPPFPDVGDKLTVNGQGDEKWVVSKVQDYQEALMIPFPRAKAKAAGAD